MGVVIITGVDNRIFPIDQAGPLVRDGTPLVDSSYAVRGGHAKLLGDARYADAVLQAIDRLNARSGQPMAGAGGADPSTNIGTATDA